MSSPANSRRVAVIFDLAAEASSYAPTLAAIGHAADALAIDVDLNVVRTAAIGDEYFGELPAAMVIGPGSPYEFADRAERVIATARERGIPLVATWAGFQHVLVEHARSQAGIADASHAEYGDVGTPVVTLLECSINGSDIVLRPTPGSLLASLHDHELDVVEHPTCNYGLERSVAEMVSSHGMTVAGIDELNEVRAIERPDHPYFIATLYQPQLQSTADTPHPVFLGLLEASSP